MLRQNVGIEGSSSRWSSIWIVVAQLSVWFRRTDGLWRMGSEWRLSCDCVDTGSPLGSYETKSEARQRVVFLCGEVPCDVVCGVCTVEVAVQV